MLSKHILHGHEISGRLAHLLATDGEHVAVEPVAGKGLAQRTGLCNLAFVVGKLQIHAPTMNVKGIAKVPSAHHCAFSVPARIAPAAVGIAPAHQMFWFRVFPECKILRVALLSPNLHPCAFLQPVQRSVGKLSVFRVRGDIKIHRTVHLVGMPGFHHRSNRFKLLRNMPCGSRRDVRTDHTKPIHHRKILVRVGFRHGHRRLRKLPCAAQQLVLPFVGIAYQVPHICDVLDIEGAESRKTQVT